MLLTSTRWKITKITAGRGTRLSRQFLASLGYAQADVDAICYAIAVHVDDKADFEHPRSLEADIVSDADNIDRFGVNRILQWCAPGMDDFHQLAENLRSRVNHLQGYLAENPLATPTGQALFAIQLKRQIAFFQALIDEYDLSKIPGD